MAVGLPIFIFLIDNPERTFMELLFTEEALEGSKHRFTTSLSRHGRWQCLRTTSSGLTAANANEANVHPQNGRGEIRTNERMSGLSGSYVRCGSVVHCGNPQ